MNEPAKPASALVSRAPITDRVNTEPPILNGMTVSEAQIIGAAAMLVWLIVGVVLYLATGLWQAIMILAMFGPASTLWLASIYLAKIKRGKPDSYYSQALHVWASRHGLIKCKFITHAGFWDLGRTLALDLSVPLLSSAAKTDKVGQT